MCRQSARSSEGWDRAAYRLGAQDMLSGRNGGKTQCIVLAIMQRSGIVCSCRCIDCTQNSLMNGGGHKAHIYRQTEHYPDSKSRGHIAPEGSILPNIVDPFIIKGLAIAPYRIKHPRGPTANTHRIVTPMRLNINTKYINTPGTGKTIAQIM